MAIEKIKILGAVLEPIKAELLQLNQTQFPSLGIFVSKKVGNQKKTKTTFIISVLKMYSMWSYFFQNPTFLLTKIPREGN
jgi:hypothetical protein